MHKQKIMALTLAMSLTAALAGCAGAKTGEGNPATDVVAQVTTVPAAAGESLLQNVTLELPENITREQVSEARDYFYADGQVVGGIALVDNASPEQTAQAVTKEAFPADYDFDYISGDCAFCEAEVAVITKEQREFGHHFFSGPQGNLDIWMDTAVLNESKIHDALKTLKADGLMTPKETTGETQPEVPLLDLFQDLELAEGYTAIPDSIRELTFYVGDDSTFQGNEPKIGGLIQTDLDYSALGQDGSDALTQYVDAMAPLPLIPEYIAMGADGSYAMNLRITNPETQEVTNSSHFFFERDGVCFDLWLDDDALTDEEKEVFLDGISLS